MKHNKAVWALAWSSDGKAIATGSEDTTVIIWSFQEKKARLHLTGHENTIAYLEWSHDGTKLASCSEDGTINIWDTHNGKCITTIHGYIGNVLNPFPVKWNKEGNELLVFTKDNDIRSFNTQNGQSKKTLVKFDETFLDMIEEEYNIGFMIDAISLVSWDKTGNFFALAESNCGQIFLFDATTYKCIEMSKSDGDTNFVSLSPEGKYVLCGPRKFHYIIISNTANLKKGKTIADDTEQNVHSVTWNPDGIRFALDSDYGSTIKVWDAETGDCTMVFKYNTTEGQEKECQKTFLSQAWHPNGIHLAAGDNEGNIIIWNTKTSKIELIFECRNEISSENYQEKGVPEELPERILNGTGIDDSNRADFLDILKKEFSDEEH